VSPFDATSTVPVDDDDYKQAVRLHSPQPPIGDIADIIVVSNRAQRSKPLFNLNPVLISQLAQSATIPGHHIVRIVPSNKIDTSLVQSWISHCERNHSLCVNAEDHSGQSNDNDELLLIDVVHKKLVRSSISARFFALSYIWGKVNQFLTTESELAALQEVGSLKKHRDRIPAVIKDAIYFVDATSERYLWVDTLCIPQDSPDRHKNIARMDEIYNGAVCTLVAVDGKDASGALHGVRPHTRQITTLGLNRDLRIARKRSDLASVCSASLYELRAWTFQERVLSRRCLYFTKEQLLFQCQTAIWSEDRYEHFQQSFGLGESFHWTHAGPKLLQASIFETYTQSALQYAKRQMSYATDRLNAFQGMLGALTKRSDWGFVCGLPIPVFTAALVWVSTTPAPRRIPTDDKNYRLPSWSWMVSTFLRHLPTM
jgi:hypothetical protein